MARSGPVQTHCPPWFRLVCPAGCSPALVLGAVEGARMVREHPAVCPDPGPAVPPHIDNPGSTVTYPLVYADMVG